MIDLPVVVAASSTSFVLSVVGLSAISGVLVALNLISLKHRSTNRVCVLAAIFVLLGWIVANFAIGVQGAGHWAPVLSTPAGRIASALLAIGFLGAVFGLIQFSGAVRFRRGRKRGVATVVGGIAGLGMLFFSDYSTRHPSAPVDENPAGYIQIDPLRAMPIATPTPSASPAPSKRPLPEDASPD